MTFLSLLRRELRTLVRLPQTYAIAAAYLIISGIFFVNILISTEIPDLARYYSNIASTLLVLIPIVAMRSFAEERRSGALDVTLSWPVSRLSVVIVKFVANTAFVSILASVIWIYYRLVARVGSIQLGRTAGGYIGLLLMVMAFNALALMVSAQAASPTAAAFLGFGLLLFLWILEYAPGWVGHSLRSLGPATHFESFPRGAIYWEDVGYFLLVTLIGLGLAVYALNRERPGPAALRSVIARGAVLGLVLVTWSGGAALAQKIDGKIDLTAAREHTLTDLSRQVLHHLSGPIRLTGFAEPLSDDADKLRSLVKEYRAAGAPISLKIIDPDAQPALARQTGISLYGQVLVEVGDRHEILDSADQGSLTSALHRLSGAPTPRACFTIGHGERDLNDDTGSGLSALAADLRRLFYDVKPLALAAQGADQDLPGCTVVVAAGPRVPLLPDELARLADYLRGDGRLVLMADGVADQNVPGLRDQLNGLLQPLGLSLAQGVISDLSALADDPSSVVSFDYPSASPPILRLREQNLPVVFGNAAPVDRTAPSDEDLSISPLVRSTAKSWTGYRKGPFMLAAISDASRLTGAAGSQSVVRRRVGLLGGVEVASNRGIQMMGNREFVTALVQWVGRAEDLVAAVRPAVGFSKVVLTEAQKNRLIRQGIVFPSLAVLVPLPLSILRLKRG